jgi:hypothetical protein
MLMIPVHTTYTYEYDSFVPLLITIHDPLQFALIASIGIFIVYGLGLGVYVHVHMQFVNLLVLYYKSWALN